MNPNTFAPELDAYEREAARRLGPKAARDARLELESHLHAESTLRYERGQSETEARAGALEAIGNLHRLARRGPSRGPVLALILAPPLYVLWCITAGLTGQFVVLSLAFVTYLGLIVFGTLARARPDLFSALLGSALAVGVALIFGLLRHVTWSGPTVVAGEFARMLVTGTLLHVLIQFVTIAVGRGCGWMRRRWRPARG